MEMGFTPESLVSAIKTLFELNNYEISGPVQIHGSEIDLVARSLTEQFSSPIYIEATVEYVSNEKYGKDTTKFVLIKEKEPGAKCLIISSAGFTINVKERSKESRIETLTYDELFQRFQNFGTYIEHITEKGAYANELSNLVNVYEKAYFNDQNGKVIAVDFLNNWKQEAKPKHNWIVVVGDYGTGKTALTKVIERTWTEQYKQNPILPIPFRIELREFSKQFDERGLIHHFLDTNKLRISIDFVFELINKGRIILILDGYDEMAQYMHIRERRSCISTLAKLSKGGAKGIITSRPNYFTTAEELNILDAFYNKIEIEKKTAFGRKSIEAIIEEEKTYDSLLKQFVERYERSLQDLDEEQTKNLVTRILQGDSQGQEIVLNILDKVFRSTTIGDEVSLSGKPVIISYLMEVIDEIKNDESSIPINSLSEWQIFDYIILKLMLRDFRRAELIHPDDRRKFLRLLSIEISSKSNFKIDEAEFKRLVNDFFHNKFKTILISEEREKVKEQYFADLRSSSTLTRILSENFWQFSHNSLREFLATEHYYSKLFNSDIKIHKIIPVSDVMKNFFTSHDNSIIEKLLDNLRTYYSLNIDQEIIGLYISLLWNGATKYYKESEDPIGNYLSFISDGSLNFSNYMFVRLKFGNTKNEVQLKNINLNTSILSDIQFYKCNFSNADFGESIIYAAKFTDCDLTNSDFNESVIEDVEFMNVDLKDANFSNTDIKLIKFDGQIYNGKDAQGILSLNGAKVDNLELIYIYKYHKNFSIAHKIASMLVTQASRQILGLTQRGASAKNPKAAKEFLDLLLFLGYAAIKPARKDLVGVTELGRRELINFVDMKLIPNDLITYFKTK